MIKPLKVTMVVYAIAGILYGLAYIFAPRQLSAMLGHEAGPSVNALLVYLGASFLPVCIFLIIAARDPLKNILWVKCAIVFAILMSVAHVYSFMLGYMDFSQPGMAMGMIVHAVFAAAFLAFYPWRTSKRGEQASS